MNKNQSKKISSDNVLESKEFDENTPQIKVNSLKESNILYQNNKQLLEDYNSENNVKQNFLQKDSQPNINKYENYFPADGRVYSSMKDVRSLANQSNNITKSGSSGNESKKMNRSVTYSSPPNVNNSSVDKNIYQLKSARDRKSQHYKKPKLFINSGKKTNDKHYKKVSEITLTDKPFSEILFKNPANQISHPYTPQKQLNRAISPTELRPASASLYQTAKERGFGSTTEQTSSDFNEIPEDIFFLSNTQSGRSSEALTNRLDDVVFSQGSEKPPMAFHSAISNAHVDSSGDNNIMKLEDDSDVSLSSTFFQQNEDLKINKIISDHIFSTDVLLNPIKKVLVKQLQFDGVDNLLNKSGNNKLEYNSFETINKTINDFYFTKHITTILKQLNTNATLLNKQKSKLEDLDIWKKEANAKVSQLHQAVEKLYEEQISRNLQQLLMIKKETETKFDLNMQQNEILIKEYSEIIESFSHLKNVKLTHLEKWSKSINKMEQYENGKHCRFMSYYDMVFVVIVCIIYYYWYR
ncbi:hypothetical protein QEN19_000506 [Hanseniaspora menglaensis]